MTKTEHYQLNQWDAVDPIRREDFNADNAAIDAVLSGKADADALAALKERLISMDDNLSALTAGLGGEGKNARLAWGSYTGTGTCGSEAPTSLSAGFFPILAVVHDEVSAGNTPAAILIRGMSMGRNNQWSLLHLTWSSTGLSWYCTDQSVGDLPAAQMNKAGQVYYYAILGCPEE